LCSFEARLDGTDRLPHAAKQFFRRRGVLSTPQLAHRLDGPRHLAHEKIVIAL
jgi:hypothetical protein